MASSNLMFSLKVGLISMSVLSAAIMLKFSAPAIADFAMYEIPSIYNGVVSWLRPPYLYLIINCIIISIVASSKFQSKAADESRPTPPLQPAQIEPQVLPVVENLETEYSKYEGMVLKNVEETLPEAYSDGNVYSVYGNVDARISETEKASGANGSRAPPEVDEDVMSNKENEFVISKSARGTPSAKGLSEFSVLNEKPPISARFGQRKVVKASPEGLNKAAVLGVSKHKKQDTLENTWKTITEGRPMPLTRHLRKSDTWEREHPLHGGSRHIQRQQEKTPPQKMTKAETFNDRTNTSTSPLLSPSPRGRGGSGSGQLKREPSLSQDELNRRVEAFIKKFNEEMRLQRQESLNQYMEMINRGAR